MRVFVALLLFGVAFNAFTQINRIEYYFDDASPDYGLGVTVNVPANTGDVAITDEISVSALLPGFHQVFFRVRDDIRGWSHPVARTFFISGPEQDVTGFRYRIDSQTGEESWTYQSFPSPSPDVIMSLELDAGNITDGIHYLEASARTGNGVWSHISKGTFFSFFAIPSKIKTLEYYFEEEGGTAGPLLSVSNFTPSIHVTLDSINFSVPVSSLVNLKKYIVYIRAVDEKGNRGFYVKDTITYHASTTGINDQIILTPEMMVYPNPASDYVNIKLITLDPAGDFFIKVFDETGRLVTEKQFSFTGADHYSLNASGFRNGVYSIMICNSSGRPLARATFIKNDR